MSVRSCPRRLRRVTASAGALTLAAALLSGCDALPQALGGDEADRRPVAAGPPGDRPEVDVNVRRGATGVAVDTIVEVDVVGAVLDRVALAPVGGPTAEAGAVAGSVHDDARRWTASERLEPGTAYALRVRGSEADGSRVRRTVQFRTADLPLDRQTYPSIAPLAGETVGVGMPVVVTFDVPVTDRRAIERHLRVTARPRQAGSWHWLSDTEVHYRPRDYWKPGTRVTVDADINSVPAGGGVYGQLSRSVDFRVGDAHVYRVDARTHQMKVFANGELLRTLPVTLGKPGFTTRSGTKVIMAKHDVKRMNSETVGIPAGSAEAYDIDDVQWAMRLTHSGEFIHAAPWSVGSQGHANVSHGCTGLSTADAGWLYAMSRRGDVVEYVGTDRPMTLENGFGDWNLSFADYREGSALR